MIWDLTFFLNSIFLGVGLAMDAFSVSLANGLNEPLMKKRRMCGIAGVFAFFQFAMPMIGWVCVSTIAQRFAAFQKFIPWIALLLLGFIGGKMLIEGIKNEGPKDENPDVGFVGEKMLIEGMKSEDPKDKKPAVGFVALLVQGIATSIDALSVGFTIADYAFLKAFVAGIIIAVVTFGICIGGLCIGKKFGTKLAGKASVLGGAILILIGIEIVVTSLIG